MNGTYSFVYCGYTGMGFGVFRVTGSEIVGSDFAGGEYRGQVVEDTATGELTLSFDMFVPAGLPIVQEVSPQDINYTKTAAFKTPPDFGDGEPLKVYIAPGFLTLMIKRIPDEYSALADGMTVTIQPRSVAAA